MNNIHRTIKIVLLLTFIIFVSGCDNTISTPSDESDGEIAIIGTAIMQVKLDGEIISPSQSIRIHHSGSETTVDKTIEVRNMGSAILYFSDITPFINNFQGNIEVDEVIAKLSFA